LKNTTDCKLVTSDLKFDELTWSWYFEVNGQRRELTEFNRHHDTGIFAASKYLSLKSCESIQLDMSNNKVTLWYRYLN